MNDSDVDQKSLTVIVHDIRGPSTTLKGFCMELEEAIAQLQETLNAHKEAMPASLHQKLNTIIDDDVNPCVKFSLIALDQLNDRLDKFEHGKKRE